jgi:hypothetical protein
MKVFAVFFSDVADQPSKEHRKSDAHYQKLDLNRICRPSRIVYNRLSLSGAMIYAIRPKFPVVALRVHLTQAAVSYPGVGRFRRAETGILGVEQTGGPMGPPIILCARFPTWIFPIISPLRSSTLRQRIRLTLGGPMRGAAFLTGDFQLVEAGQDLAEGREIMARDRPLVGKLAVSVGHKDASPAQPTRRERLLAKESAYGAAGHV